MGRCARGIVSGVLFLVLVAWGVPGVAAGSPDGPERSIVRVVPGAEPRFDDGLDDSFARRGPG